ncbi:hypothetical protein ACFLZW_06580 [Chloroflexota bacterium]
MEAAWWCLRVEDWRRRSCYGSSTIGEVGGLGRPGGIIAAIDRLDTIILGLYSFVYRPWSTVLCPHIQQYPSRQNNMM